MEMGPPEGKIPSEEDLELEPAGGKVASEAECCPTGACCCSSTSSGRARWVRTIIFLLIVLGALALVGAALADRYGWLASSR